MKEEDPLTPEEILKDALPAIDGPDFEDCGTEFKKDLRWAVALKLAAHLFASFVDTKLVGTSSKKVKWARGFRQCCCSATWRMPVTKSLLLLGNRRWPGSEI